MALQHLRSSTANKRPTPGAMSDGQLAMNTNLVSPGLFLKDSNGDLVKVGPVHVGTTAPNATPGVGGQAGNSKGEQWLDTSSSRYVFKIWDGTAWRTEDGEFVNVSGDTMTGALGIIAGTAAAPAIQVGTGTTVKPGIYSPGADQLAFSTGGTGRLFIDANGALTVTRTGTSGNAATINGFNGYFEIQSTRTTGGSYSRVTGSYAGNATDFWMIGSNGYTDGAFSIWAGANAQERLRITSTGTVNIVGAGTAGSTQTVSFNGSAPVNSLVLDNSGRLLVGTSIARAIFNNSTATAALQIEGASADAANISITRTSADAGTPIVTFAKSRGSVGGTPIVVTSGDLIGFISFEGGDGTEFVRGASISAEVDGTPGANDMPGRLVFSTTADGASSPTERMRISSSGSIFVGTTDGASPSIGARGFFRAYGNSDPSSFVAEGYQQTVGYINREVNDGALLEFRQAGIAEGTISVSGTTVSYNGAHLSRWSQLPSGTERKEILRGTVLSNIDEMCEWGEEENEQLNRMKVSDVEGDKNVSGVFQCWDDDDDTYTNDFYCAMTGDFIIRIAAGVTVERGDLLMSAGDGTAKPQDDDIIRSKTIAKVTSTTVSCTYEDGSYCVPCVLMAC